jgi:hypothetical protein
LIFCVFEKQQRIVHATIATNVINDLSFVFELLFRHLVRFDDFQLPASSNFKVNRNAASGSREPLSSQT